MRGKPAGAGGSLQCKVREGAAIFGEFALALQDVNVNAGLIVHAGGVLLLRAGRNGGVARNNFGDRAAVGFDAERKRSDVEQQHVADAALQNVGLHCGAQRDDFVGIEFGVRLAAEKVLHGAANQRSAGGAADEDDFFDGCGARCASVRACFTGAMVRATMGWMIFSNSLARKFVSEQFAIRKSET